MNVQRKMQLILAYRQDTELESPHCWSHRPLQLYFRVRQPCTFGWLLLIFSF